ncbi:MAG TPA: GNAT family N-acetyltransferase, partial [Stellaceae bacterium]|nr:GNAT family N-acetyltransferase [Stellaceae bacterium]
LALRDRSGADALSDPSLATEHLLHWLVPGAVMVWEKEAIAGFAAINGDKVYLLVDPAQRSKGIGRALLAWACNAIRDAGYGPPILTLAAGSTAERHYRAAGWREVGRTPTGGVILKAVWS